MTQEATTQNYEFASSGFLKTAVAGTLLEFGQNIPHIHEVMPEPFDITNHAGNLWVGAAVAYVAIDRYTAKNRLDDKSYAISDESMSTFRKRGVAMIMGATALANCITETQWGVQYLPVNDLLGGTTPDVLDTVYSTVWSGILSLAFWKKTKPTI